MTDDPGQSFKYDVAFSFLSEDEGLATEINDLIQDRVETFLYSRRQGEIVGKDGEEEFGRVFGAQARIVVVIYREGWGSTPFTRIEQTAIKNRAFESGYGFTVFIPVAKGAKIPPWLPRCQLYLDRDRWGTRGAATIIEDRIRAAGGEPRQETVEDRAARLTRKVEAERRSLRFRSSPEGVQAARASFDQLLEKLEELRLKTTSSSVEIKSRIDAQQRGGLLWGPGASLSVGFSSTYSNSLDNSVLGIILWKGRPQLPNEFPPLERPQELSSSEYDFDLGPSGDSGWRRRGGDGKLLSADALAERFLDTLLEGIEKHRRK